MLDDRTAAPLPGRFATPGRTAPAAGPTGVNRTIPRPPSSPSSLSATGDEPTVRIVLPPGGLSTLMGHRPTPPPLQPTPAAPRTSPGRDRLRGLAALAAVAGAGIALRAVGLYSSPAPRPDEAALVNQVADPGSMGLEALAGRLGALAAGQVATLIRVGDGWDRAPSALGAVREVSLLAWAVTAVACWLLARRLGVSRPWALGAVVVLALSPAAVAASRLAVPENLAVTWAMAALVLAAGPTRVGRAQFRSDLMVAVFLLVAALTAPPAAALTAAVVALVARHGDQRRTLLLAAMCLPALVAAAFGAGRPTGPGIGTWPASGWLGPDPVTVVLVVLVGGFALASARHRWVGVGLLAVLAGAAALGVPASGLYPLLVPLAAIGSAVLGQDRTVPVRRLPGPVAGAVLLVPPAARLPAVTLAVLVLGWSTNLLSLPSATAPPPSEWAREWLRGNVPPGEQVMTDDITHTALTPGGPAWDRLVTPAVCERQARLSAAPSAGRACSTPDWWVVSGTHPDAPSDSAPAAPAGPAPALTGGGTAPALTGGGTAPAPAVAGVAAAVAALPATPATLVARFGTDGAGDRIEIWTTRWPAPDPAREAMGRQAAGQMLAASSQLTATAEQADRLRAGLLDARAATALGGLLSEQPVRLVALPEVPGEQAIGRPLRQLLLAPAPAGALARGLPPRAQQRIVDFFTAQLAPFRPYSMAITPSGVLVRYSPQGPPGLLDSLVPR